MTTNMRFGIDADDNGSAAFARFARSVEGASVAVDKNSAALALQAKTAKASADATLSLARTDKTLADANRLLAGRTEEAALALRHQGKAAEESAAKTRLAGEAAKGAGGGFAALQSPMAAAVGAGAALAPIAVTLGAGLGGLGLAALSTTKNAKAMHDTIGPLRSEVTAFQASLQPEVLTLFGQGAGIAETALHGLQPVALETGKALSGVLGDVSKELHSGEFQDFFGWMAKTAGPDVQLLGRDFVDLAADIPPVLKVLQPVATGLLKITDAVANLPTFLDKVKQKTGASQQGFWGGTGLDKIREFVSWGEKHIPAGNKSLSDLAGLTGKATSAAAGTSAAIAASGDAAALTSPKVMTLTQQVGHLTDAYNSALTPLLTYSNAQIAQAGDAVTLNQALKVSHDRIGLATDAQRSSFTAANTYIQSLLNTASAAVQSGKGVDAQIGSIRNALPVLQHVRGGTRDYWLEVQQLVGWLRRLEQQKKITETVTLYGNGSWAVPSQRSPSSGPGGGHQLAAGWLLSGGVPGKDSIPLLGMPGELMVPKRLVDAGAVDHLRGLIPGFARGGIVPSYSGAIKGLQPWAAANNAATVTALTSGLASAMARQFAALASAGAIGVSSGALGGDAAANKALAMRLFPWPMSMWPSFDYLEMREAGYNRFARNPSSGAYGIPQALPPTKMPFAAQAAGGSHAGPQLSWMFSYISGRYGNPVNAAGHERAVSWYGGGLDAVFGKPTIIGVAERGKEHVTVTPVGKEPSFATLHKWLLAYQAGQHLTNHQWHLLHVAHLRHLGALGGGSSISAVASAPVLSAAGGGGGPAPSFPVRARGTGGDTYVTNHVTVNVPVGAHPAQTGAAVVKAITDYERLNGRGWRTP